MCGIAGILTWDGAPPDEERLRRVSVAIAHRGPDAEGVWIRPGIGLAHRRLSIIDLSPTGAQPMTDASGRYTIVYNGEIYNYRELRVELERHGVTFRSQSDTEVILEAYRLWGTECLVRLRGMFAFGLWDTSTRQLLLARDQIGKKPLFYTQTPKGDVIFASELKALAADVALRPSFDDVRLFLGLQYVPAPRTGFKNVFQLLPGSFVVVDTNGIQEPARYHEFPASSQALNGESSKDIDEKIRELLEEAVNIRQMAADVPVGAFLSGGVDSAAVVAFAVRHTTQQLQTFTMGFPNLHMDERREAREIAQTFGTRHAEFEARPEHLLSLVEELVAHYDAPYADSSALPLWMLAKETAKQVKVVLTGDGGDEVFGGYRRYVAYEQASAIARLPLIPGVSLPMLRLASIASHDPRFLRMGESIATFGQSPSRAYGELFTGSYFSSRQLASLCTPEFFAQTKSADAVDFVTRRMVGDSSLSAAMRFDLTSYLPDDLNVKMDRATMRFGLEARAPFLDQELIAYALRLPMKEKVSHGKTKIALKRALQGIVPDDVLRRKKRGFQVPLAEWFRGPLRSLIEDRCLDPQSRLSRIVQISTVRRLIEENARGADHGNRLWMLLSLSLWLEKYGG